MRAVAVTLVLSLVGLTLVEGAGAQVEGIKKKSTGSTAGAPAAVPPTTGGVQQSGGAPPQVAALPIPLASFAEGQAMMAKAAENAALLSVKFTFLDKTYKNDVWTGPSYARVRVSCVRFKASSGFDFEVDVPKFTLNAQGLTVEQNISRIKADGLSAKFQLGPCHDVAVGIGVQLTDVKEVYKSRPVVTFSSDGACTVHWNQDTDDTRVSIGDLNILGVQNDIDKLAKDAAREAINAALDGFYGVLLRNELLKVSMGTCGGSKKT